MTYYSSVSELFTLRAPARAIAPSLPILLLPRLQYGTVIHRTNPGEPRTAYVNSVTELFTLRAPASATAPSRPMSFFHSL
jgi:hypothetical protein